MRPSLLGDDLDGVDQETRDTGYLGLAPHGGGKRLLLLD